jgi:hypothetical protein
MAENRSKRRRHFLVDGRSKVEPFERPPGGGGVAEVVPERNRGEHAARLREDLANLGQEMTRAVEAAREAGEEDWSGLLIEFELIPGLREVFQSLERIKQGIELRNIRQDSKATWAIVFVKNGKLEHFERLISDYLARKARKDGRPRDNQRLIDAITSIRTATLRALWTDEPELFPKDEDEALTWEIWLPRGKGPLTTIARFARHAGEVRIAPGWVGFPDRIVVLAVSSARGLRQSVLTLNSIAELRRGREAASFFDDLPSREQAEWVEELRRRTIMQPIGADVPHVCILDSGVNRGHPLLEGALAARDLHTVEPGWGVEDGIGHGTEMAGLALFGDLGAVLESSDTVEVRHRLESVKVLRAGGSNGDDPRHLGYLTQQAVARPESLVPHRQRVHAMALTAQGGHRDLGLPSAWSAAVDGLASGIDSEVAGPKRLFLISAGNVREPADRQAYPDSNASAGIEDPAQAWNAVAVGAYTELDELAESGLVASPTQARRGELSPFSRTSVPWERRWPLKPDILLEGGNVVRDGTSAQSLSLLTTNYRPTERLFTTMNATSAATALAARLAAQIQSHYPEAWPETIRGLLVHSAEWTSPMRVQFLGSPNLRGVQKGAVEQLVRRCGFGVPNLERALWTVRGSVTLIAQREIQPFDLEEPRKSPRLNQMCFHDLPWPRQTLLDLGEVEVELRVTLSYFVEPNPSRRGSASRYRYESHGLRFDVSRPTETADSFRRRVNAAAEEQAEESLDRTAEGGADPGWALGVKARHRGSLHSDLWLGSAADLAERSYIAVYPTSGWWKLRKALGAWNRRARYSLIVSIRSPAAEIDLITEIASSLGVPVEV